MFSPPNSRCGDRSGKAAIFFRAPNFHCAISGVFVIPEGRTLVEYARTDDGWSSVIDFNSRAGGDAEGWVRSARLKAMGTVGPKQ